MFHGRVELTKLQPISLTYFFCPGDPTAVFKSPAIFLPFTARRCFCGVVEKLSTLKNKFMNFDPDERALLSSEDGNLSGSLGNLTRICW